MKYLLLITLILSFSSFSNEALDVKIEKSIKSYLEAREGYKVNYQIKGKINGHSQELLLIQWSMLGATYWQSYLSIFSADSVELSTIKLLGITKNVQIKEGSILIDIKRKGPNDPRCCPSIEEKQYYYIESGSITRIKES